MTHAFNNPRWEQERKARMGRMAGWRTIDSAPKLPGIKTHGDYTGVFLGVVKADPPEQP